jgi:hypothetical protein
MTSRAYDDVPDDFETDATIASGQTVNGEFELAWDFDMYRLEAAGGRLYTFNADGVVSPDGTATDLHFHIYDEFGNDLVHSAFDGDPARARLLTEAPGTYFVQVWANGGNGTGAYKLGLTSRAYVDDYGGDQSTLGTLAPGETRKGDVATEHDEDWFRVSLTAGETYIFDMKGKSSGAGTLVDPLLFLIDPDGNWVADNYDSGAGEDARLTYTAGATGDYFIVARDEWTSGFGTYALSMQADDPLAA